MTRVKYANELGARRRITKLWITAHDYRDIHGERYTVGQNGVTSIEEHHAAGEGDQWFYDVYLDDGRVIREFAPHAVEFAPEAQDG